MSDKSTMEKQLHGEATDSAIKDAPNNNCYEFAECRGLIV